MSNIVGYPYFIAPNDVFDNGNLKPLEKLTLLFFCRAASGNGTSYYSQIRIAEKVGISKRELQRCIKKLVELGYLRVYHRKYDNGQQISNIYQLIPPGGDKESNLGVTPCQGGYDRESNKGLLDEGLLDEGLSFSETKRETKPPTKLKTWESLKKENKVIKSPIPDELVPDERTKLYAMNISVPSDELPSITEDYLDYLKAEGREQCDYQAGLRRWIRGWKKRNYHRMANNYPKNSEGEKNERDQALRTGRCPQTGRKLAPGEINLLQEEAFAEQQRLKQEKIINPRNDGLNDAEVMDEDEQSLRASMAIDLW